MHTVLIADDETPARKRIHRLLGERKDIKTIQECADGQSTLDTLTNEKVDVVFLDIQMPVLTGFEVLAALPEEAHRPAVIFTTAFDQHALDAFSVAAVDYLLKPFKADRFHSALDRALANLNSESEKDAQQEGHDQLLQQLFRYSDLRIPVRDGDNVIFLRARAIDYVEAAGNYLVIYSKGNSHIHRETMTSMEKRLSPVGFYRINRSHLVNLARVQQVNAPPGGPNRIILEDETVLPLTGPLHKFQNALATLVE